MPDRPPAPDDNDATAAESGRDTRSRPRWVKLSGIVVLVLLLLLVVIMLIAGGSHGPGRHSGFGSTPPLDLAQTGWRPGGALAEGPVPERPA
jgi:hypothetical protein